MGQKQQEKLQPEQQVIAAAVCEAALQVAASAMKDDLALLKGSLLCWL